MPLHVSSICTHHQDVEIALRNLWYHHTQRWPSHVQFQRGLSVINQLDAKKVCFSIRLFNASTCFEHMCSSSGSQNNITQSL